MDVININMGLDTAHALDARRIQVRVPIGASERVAFLAQLDQLQVSPERGVARVIVNSRTGSVVMNQAVSLQECAVAHGNLSVSVSTTDTVSQPNPLSAGQTTVTQAGQVDIKQEGSRIVRVAAGANLAEVVKALNAVGANPLDLINILQAMKAAGALRAELEVI